MGRHKKPAPSEVASATPAGDLRALKRVRLSETSGANYFTALIPSLKCVSADLCMACMLIEEWCKGVVYKVVPPIVDLEAEMMSGEVILLNVGNLWNPEKLRFDLLRGRSPGILSHYATGPNYPVMALSGHIWQQLGAALIEKTKATMPELRDCLDMHSNVSLQKDVYDEFIRAFDAFESDPEGARLNIMAKTSLPNMLECRVNLPPPVLSGPMVCDEELVDMAFLATLRRGITHLRDEFHMAFRAVVTTKSNALRMMNICKQSTDGASMRRLHATCSVTAISHVADCKPACEPVLCILTYGSTVSAWKVRVLSAKLPNGLLDSIAASKLMFETGAVRYLGGPNYLFETEKMALRFITGIQEVVHAHKTNCN